MRRDFVFSPRELSAGSGALIQVYTSFVWKLGPLTLECICDYPQPSAQAVDKASDKQMSLGLW